MNTCSYSKAICPHDWNHQIAFASFRIRVCAALAEPLTSGLIYTPHMDVIGPPACMNLYLDWGRKKQNKKHGDILWPASDHVSGIKVEEVGGLVGSFYTHGWSSPHGFKKKPTDLMVSSHAHVHFPPSFSSSACRHWPLTSPPCLVCLQYLLSLYVWCICSSRLSVPRTSSRFLPFVESFFLPLRLLWRLVLWLSVKLVRIFVWTISISKFIWIEGS